jgi:perosamine synthetase
MNKLHLPIAQPDIGEDELRNVTDAVKSGWVSSKGPFIEAFEKDFSAYNKMRYGVCCSNGTTALHLALVALGIGKGDKVIVPSLTFISVANAVTYTGAIPVFVDSNPTYWNMEPEDIKRKIDSHTKAIIVVHLYGHPCDMDQIMAIAQQHGLLVIEDCAEAHGAKYKDRLVGTFGDVSCFSFFGNKIMTTGEGGMCLTNSDRLAEKMKILRDHGMNPNKRYWHDVIGFNYRMTNLQAAIGVAQVKKLDSFVAQKRRLAAQYIALLGDCRDIRCSPELPWATSVYWLFSIQVPRGIRNELIRHLEKQGIESRPFFHPIHKMPPYMGNYNLPVAEEVSATGINLPSGSKLSERDIQQVTQYILTFVNQESEKK